MTEGRVLIDASNLRGGGGLQVGVSVVDELATLVTESDTTARYPWLLERLDLHISPEVAEQASRGFPAALAPVVTRRSWRAFKRERNAHAAYDVSFVVFGPEYGPARARHRIVGFADGVSLQGPMSPLIAPGAAARAKHLVRRRISRSSFTGADEIVVEAPHVATLLTRRWGVAPGRIHIVPNTVAAIFRGPLPLPQPATFDTLDDHSLPWVFFPTRLHPHKNLAVLGAVGNELADRGRAVRFVLTLTDSEWVSLPLTVRSHALNVGPLRVGQLPAAYDAVDAVVFPSLLESFSVTPLEAMVCAVPLAAADRDYVRDVADGAAAYADPTDPVALADAVLDALTDSPERRTRLALGRSIAEAWPDSRARALAYLDLIDLALGAA